MKPARVFRAIGLFLLLAGPSLHAACTSATAAGTFGFTTTGTLILPSGPVPVGAVGLITFQLNGDVSGNQDRSVGGIFAHETITGTRTVNRDCTISLLANVFDSSGTLVRTSTIAGVLVNNGKQIRGIFETVVLANGVSLDSVLTVDADRVQGHAQ
ncbi:MAG: hypothetical protein DMG84_20545 [Acidobacteria bacterium]|nr:MAG: hypothetical protein DMG84_20545 [Acidobacteriota bacterium]